MRYDLQRKTDSQRYLEKYHQEHCIAQFKISHRYDKFTSKNKYF